ncbi:MAG: hypothetical protein ABI353_14780 [Isosphaeraceae bacterium]
MGANFWSHIVPYQIDMDKVLEDLQHDIFLRGVYQKPGIDLSLLDDMDFFDVDEDARELMIAEYTLGPLREPVRRFGLAGLRAWLESLDEAPGIQTREELEALQCLSWDGTGSILDIGGVSQEPRNGAIFPLSRELLLKSFGTDHPTRDMLPIWRQRWDQAMMEPLPYERGQGIYFVLYQDGRPSEIYIEGATGD